MSSSSSFSASFSGRNVGLFAIIFALLAFVGIFQSWSLAFALLNLCLISAVMALGVNMQWGYAGLLNVGVMGFVALGGVATVVINTKPVQGAIDAGGQGIVFALLSALLTIFAAIFAYKFAKKNSFNAVWPTLLVVAIGFFVMRYFLDPAVSAIESFDSAATGNLGGLGLPNLFAWVFGEKFNVGSVGTSIAHSVAILLSWLVGGAFAAAVAWVIGKISLGLRADYFAIATLGISEIIIAVLKNEDWIARGVKNVNGLPRPVAYEFDLQQAPWFQNLAETLGVSVVEFSSIWVKLSYAMLFVVVLLIVLWLSEKALNSPWGRMMRAIRDNETAASAMGKNVKKRHLQVFVLGSAVIGIAGAMLTTLDGQFTPASYQPLRFTFLIWVMVIVGGSGNNWGAVLGGFLIWFFWIEAEPMGLIIMKVITMGMADGFWLKEHLIESAAHMRLITMGLVLLLVLRFTPQGLIPERKR